MKATVNVYGISLLLILFSVNDLESTFGLRGEKYSEELNAEVACQINCPSEMVVNLDPGSCDDGTTVNYTVTTSGCLGGAIQTSGLPSGSFFPLGTTSNCFQAVDILGNLFNCCFNVVVSEFPGSTTLACNDNVQVSVNNTCFAPITTDMILEGGPYGCYDDYLVTVEDYGSGFGTVVLTSDAVGQTLAVTITDPETGNECYGTISIEDKLPPVISCPINVTIGCGSTLPSITGSPIAFDNCTEDCEFNYTDTELPGDCELIIRNIKRHWVASDESGNEAECDQIISIQCQARNITFPNVQGTQLTVRWLPGSGDHRLVILSPNGNFNAPSQGVEYTADNHYDGSGQQVVYNGPEDEVTVTMLQPNTTYWFRVYESNYCPDDPFYLLNSGVLNTKSQTTTNQSDPGSIIPFPILSPLPCIGNPGFYQSELHINLYNAPKYMAPDCIDAFECDQINWNHSPIHGDKTTFCELMPKAIDCFGAKDYTWEFRQRGHITGKRKVNDPSMCETPCGTETCSSTSLTVSHYSDGCDTRDDRLAWDVNYISKPYNIAEKNICIYAVEEGTVFYQPNKQSVYIKHPVSSSSGNYWYSYYDNIVPKLGLDSVQKNQHIGRIKDKGSNTHLHFGVYYKMGSEYISVNGPIKINNENNGMPYSVSNIHCTISGSKIRNARIFKSNNGFFEFLGQTNEVGRLSVTSIPGINTGDSLRIIAGGYNILDFQFDDQLYNNFNFVIPMIVNDNNLNIKNPTFDISPNKIIYDSSDIILKISGDNLVSYDVSLVQSFDSESEVMILGSNVSPTDSIFEFSLSKEGYNTIRVSFNGADTIYVEKEILYSSQLAKTHELSIQADSQFLHSQIYINGNYFKDIETTISLIPLPPNPTMLTLVKSGYIDTSYTILSDTVIQVLMEALSQKLFTPFDSTKINFAANGSIQYARNITMQDSSGLSSIYLKQFWDDFTETGLHPKSRKIEFINASQTGWSNIGASISLNQPEFLSAKKTYLLNIVDDTLFRKINFTTNDDLISYDSTSQKINYKYVNFGKGINSKESLVMMKKLAPKKIPLAHQIIEQNDSLCISLDLLSTDPDSIKNDMNFEFVNNSPLIRYTFINGQVCLIADQCGSGNTYVAFAVTHDGITVQDTIFLEIIPSPIPTVVASGPITFCEGDSVMLTVEDLGTYQWSTGITSKSIVVNTNGIFSVIVTDSNGCTASSEPVTISVYDNPSVELGPDTLIASEETIIDAGNPGSIFLWNTGETTSSIIVIETGWYFVEVTNYNNCTTRDSIYVEIITNSIEVSKPENLVIYPNPNKGKFIITLEIPNTQVFNVLVFNSLGQEVYTSESKEVSGKYSKEISIESMAKGVYYVQISIGQKKFTSAIKVD